MMIPLEQWMMTSAPPSHGLLDELLPNLTLYMMTYPIPPSATTIPATSMQVPGILTKNPESSEGRGNEQKCTDLFKQRNKSVFI